MPQHLHELPTDAQFEHITHVLLHRTIIDTGFITMHATYGKLDDSNEFTETDLVGTHKIDLRGQDLKDFMQTPSNISTLPDVFGDTVQDAAKSIAKWMDDGDRWHTQRSPYDT